MTETVGPLAGILKEYGPWAICVILGLWGRFLYNEVGAANARTIAMAERVIPLVTTILPLIQDLQKQRDRERDE